MSLNALSLSAFPFGVRTLLLFQANSRFWVKGQFSRLTKTIVAFRTSTAILSRARWLAGFIDSLPDDADRPYM
jgi:hypothetical protein